MPGLIDGENNSKGNQETEGESEEPDEGEILQAERTSSHE